MRNYRPRAGDRVRFNGYTKEQVNWGGNDTPFMLVAGSVYTVEEVVVYSQHTKVRLQGVSGRFNSVHFGMA